MTPIIQFVDQSPHAASAPCFGCILVPRSLAREVMP